MVLADEETSMNPIKLVKLIEEYGIDVTWQALDKFFSADYDENEYTLKGKELDLYLANKQNSKYDDFDADAWNSKF